MQAAAAVSLIDDASGRASSRVIPAPCSRDAGRRRDDTNGDAPERPVAWPDWNVAEVILTGKLTRDRAVHRGQFGGRCWKKDPPTRIVSERPHRIGRALLCDIPRRAGRLGGRIRKATM